MKLSALTIGQRVALGFALLLLLGSGLGGYAIYKMHNASSGAQFLAVAVAPQASVTSNLAQASALTQRAVRTFSFTGDEDQLATARKHLGEIESSLEEARKLAAAQPALTALRDAVTEAGKALKSYSLHFDETVANLNGLTKVREQLDSSATTFVREINAYIDTQSKKLADEIAAGLPAEKLEPRRIKTELANTILDDVNSIRIAAFKAQALRQPDFVNKALPLFDRIEATRLKIVPLTLIEADLKQLAQVEQAVAAYKQGVTTLVQNLADNGTIAKARAAAGAEFDKIVENVLNRSITRTLAFAEESSAGLSAASRGVMIGLAIMVVLGIATALLIIRGVNRALTQTADSLSQGALQIAAASGQVSSASQALAEGASEQAASLEEISSSIEELSSMTKRNAENAKAGKASAGHARTAAEAGAGEMERMQAAMNAIQQSSSDISKIIKTIDEIAFQTNILALNAAVEAARAGEAGAGFAVVADEVRSLAQRSAVAAKETADKIADATTRSAQGVELSTRVTAGLREILEKAREVDRLVAEVATASQEQSEGLTQINVAVSQMDKVTQSNAASAEETASAAEELNAQSEELRNNSFQLAALVGIKTVDDSAAGVPHAAASKKAPKKAVRSTLPPVRGSAAGPQASAAHSGLSFKD